MNKDMAKSQLKGCIDFVAEAQRMLSKVDLDDKEEKFRVRAISSQLHQAVKAADILTGILES